MAQLVKKFQNAGKINKGASSYEESLRYDSDEIKSKSQSKSQSNYQPYDSNNPTQPVILKNSSVVNNTLINDLNRINALQNSEHDNWRDAYAEYSGKNGSWRERRNFRRDWKDKANVRARVGEDTYDQLRAESEQKQFGTQGYNSGSTREQNRFNRKFNRKVRNGSLRPRVTNTPESTFTKSGTVLYPWLHDYKLPGSVWNTYNRTMNWLGQYLSNLTGVKEGVEEGDPIEKPTPIDYNAEGIKLLGEEYMTPEKLTKIQQFLVSKNYDLGNYGADGKYGQKTNDALVKYLNEVGNAPGLKNISALFDKPADPITQVVLTQAAYLQEMEPNLDKNKIKFLDTANSKSPGVIDLGGSRFDKSKFNEELLLFLHNMFNLNYSYKGVTPNFSKVALVKDGLQHTYYLDDLKLNSIDNFNTGLTLFPDGSVAKVTDNGLHFLDDNFKNHPNFRPAYLKGPNQTVTIDGITYPSAVSTGLFGNNYGIKNDHTYAYDAETNSIRKVHENLFGEVSRGNKVRWAPNSEWINLSNIPSNYNVFYQKQGGKMNKIKYFQRGGAAPQQDMLQQIMQLVQAAMQGDQKATQTIQQVMQAAEQGDQQAMQLAQMIQQVAEQMKG